MSEYWAKHYSEAARLFKTSPLKQVGKTVSGVEVEQSQIDLIVDQISKNLALSDQDTLADLGCGNGVLTVRLSKLVKQAIGVDFTDEFIEYAKKNHASGNLTYIKSNLITVDSEGLRSANKFSMYEVLQHLSKDDLSSVLGSLTCVPGSKFFIGGVPDITCLRKFYNTKEKYDYYLRCERQGEPHLGSWWKYQDVEDVAIDLGWKVKILPQQFKLYSSYYRFDVLLEKIS